MTHPRTCRPVRIRVLVIQRGELFAESANTIDGNPRRPRSPFHIYIRRNWWPDRGRNEVALAHCARMGGGVSRMLGRR